MSVILWSAIEARELASVVRVPKEIRTEISTGIFSRRATRAIR
jgi:hypothetical protein